MQAQEDLNIQENGPEFKPVDPLRILVFGAGAIGTYIGGSLALDGHTVVFLEHPAVVAELRQRGLRLEVNGVGRYIAFPDVVSSIEDALHGKKYDLGILALKSFDTQAILKNLAGHKDKLPPILCLQNGVENEALIATVLGEEKVIPATVTSAVGKRAAGDIVVERLRGVGIASTHPLSTRLADAMGAAGLQARLFNDARSMKWSKLLTNLVANASSAILDLPPKEIFAHPELYRLEMTQLRETLDVMAAQRVEVIDLPGTPARLLAFAVRLLPRVVSQPFLSFAVGGGRGGKMPSFHIDLHSGRGKSEVGYLNGAVTRFGAQLGVATPANRLLNETLLALTNAELPLDAYKHKPDKLLEAWKSYH